MIQKAVMVCWGIFAWGLTVLAADDVVINELNYNPYEDAPTEFVELYNPTNRVIDLSQYSFTDGIYFTFPAAAKIDPGQYAVVVRYRNAAAWSGVSYPVYGSYIGDLADGGELIRLRSTDGRVVDEVKYNDVHPWSRGADGYGPSLERISPDLPSSDSHTWRSSLKSGTNPRTPGGSPGAKNTVDGIDPKPTLVSWSVNPPYPTSKDKPQIDLILDGAERIEGVTLRVETVRESTVGAIKTYPMTFQKAEKDHATYRAELTAFTSQTLVRMSFNVHLTGGGSLFLPPVPEPRPFESFFVYDNEIPARIPLLWLYPRISTKLTPSSTYVSGVAIKPVTLDHVLVYDGARIVDSRNGQKIRFLKHEEYLDNRTLNVIPEMPSGGTTSGAQAPQVEHISFRIFRDFGVLAPVAYWFRIIERGRHTQRILVQQPNENFLKINGRDPSANIYKVAYNEPGGVAKMTNINEGNDDYTQLLSALNQNSDSKRKAAVYRYLNVEEVMAYSVAGVLMSNWDGFFNNMFLYHDPSFDQWECIPWDLDKTFGYTDSDPMFVEMPLNYPLDGYARKESRAPGPISRPFHRVQELHEEYIHRLRDALGGLFSQERINGLVDDLEKLLLDDLSMEEQYTKATDTTRRQQIINSSEVMRRFVRLRHEYLRSVLPVPVSDWPLH